MALTTQIEDWATLMREADFDAHYDELSVHKEHGIDLKPRHDDYLAACASGRLLVVTLRDRGVLVGYFVAFVGPGLHYGDCLTCTPDIFRVVPSHRGHFGGLRLFRAVERELRHRGVKAWMVGSKDHNPSTRLFEALGFDPMERIYVKWL